MAEFEKIVDALSRSRRIVALSHADSDGDSLGCLIALKRALECIGKEVFLPAPNSFPRRYAFMRKYTDGWGCIPQQCDAVLIVDCSIRDRIDWGEFRRNENIQLLNADHHESNTLYGDINWVDASSASAGEMIFKILNALHAPIDDTAAAALYIAIMTDTGRFSFANTTPNAMRTAAQLIALGANPKFLTAQVYFDFSEEHLRNIGIALFNSRSYNSGRIVFLTLDIATTRNLSTSPDDSDGIIDFAMAVRNVDVAALFREVSSKQVRVSLRSRRGINISEVARFFGGGGHPNACGCIIEGNLAMAQEAILNQIRRILGCA